MPKPALYEKFESLFREHYSKLAEYAYSIVKDRDDAEDVVQDVFIKIWQNKPAIIENEGIKFYLFTATKNTCISLLRKQSMVVSLEEQDKGLQLAAVSEKPVSPSVDYSALITEAFSLLPPQCRAIFKMSRLANLTYVQIATELNLSVKTIENQMGKAIRIMREFARQKNIPLPVIIIWLTFFIQALVVHI